MGMHWLLDQDDGNRPTALVETDGGMHIIDIHRFGPGITELDDQQKVWDSVIGRLVPTMKPFVDASWLDEDGVEPNTELRRGEGPVNRSGRLHDGGQGIGRGRASQGPSKKRSRGER